VASNDISACMMDHGSGKALTDECIREVRRRGGCWGGDHADAEEERRGMRAVKSFDADGGDGGPGCVCARLLSIRRWRSVSRWAVRSGSSAPRASGSFTPGTPRTSRTRPQVRLLVRLIIVVIITVITIVIILLLLLIVTTTISIIIIILLPLTSLLLWCVVPGEPVLFDQAKPDQLCSDPSCWTLQPGAEWHGSSAAIVSSLITGCCIQRTVRHGMTWCCMEGPAPCERVVPIVGVNGG
jgi:hypothetical protein